MSAERSRLDAADAGEPRWRDLILFHEYFHGDNGAGIGASHQTGWTGMVASLIQLFGDLTTEDVRGTGGRPSVVYERHERADQQ